MTELNFYAELDYLLNTTECSALTIFRELPFWSSLTGFELLCFLESDCGITLKPDELKQFSTCGDLFQLTQQDPHHA